MRRRLVSALTAATLAGGAALVAVGPAAATAPPAGTSSLAAVLAADGDAFDRNWYDFDIVDRAVRTVLAAKPTSPVALLADGTVPLTAFLPNDRAFQVLVADLTRKFPLTEQKTFDAVASLGVDTVETVLLYHVVPGATLTSSAAFASDGAVFTTAQGGTVTLDVLSQKARIAQLIDADTNDINAFLVRSKLDLNAGNVQIAHGVAFVMRPVDLR